MLRQRELSGSRGDRVARQRNLPLTTAGTIWIFVVRRRGARLPGYPSAVARMPEAQVTTRIPYSAYKKTEKGPSFRRLPLPCRLAKTSKSAG
jgi:hypothetical protein